MAKAGNESHPDSFNRLICRAISLDSAKFPAPFSIDSQKLLSNQNYNRFDDDLWDGMQKDFESGKGARRQPEAAIPQARV